MRGRRNLDGGMLNLERGMLNLEGGALTLYGGTRPLYNLCTAVTYGVLICIILHCIFAIVRDMLWM